MAKFQSREQAGQQLSSRLLKFQGEQPVVLAVLNGGVPVAVPISKTLNTSLTVVPMRSLHIPWAEQTIFGYVTNTGEMHLNHPLIGQTRLSQAEIYQIARKRRRVLETDLESWGVTVPETLEGTTALIVDDGMHSGWTMFSAIETVKLKGALKVIAAVPVTHFRAKRFVSRHCDEVVTLLMEEIALYEIQNYYEDFPKISNPEAGSLLRQARNPRPTAA
jgi:putative phosphoribosyl transferase